MSTKSLLWILGLVVVAAGAWYLWSSGSLSSVPGAASDVSSEAQPSAVLTQEQGAQSLSNGSANADLDADLQALDSQLGDASADASAAGSFNDTPVEQTE